MDQLHTANKVCGGCCAISLNTVDTESSVSPTGTFGIRHEDVLSRLDETISVIPTTKRPGL